MIAEWQPILAADLSPGEPGTDPSEPLDRPELETLAAARGLQPLRWPEPWPGDTRLAMLTATYAKQIGRVVAFSLAAFRQAFAGGRDLAEESTVLIAAAACEMHPAAVLKAARLRSVATALERATAAAAELGVRSVPAVLTGGAVFHGDAGLDEAAQALAEHPRESSGWVP